MIPSKEELKQFFAAKEPPTRVVPFPELGDGVELRIGGYTVGDTLTITELSSLISQDGSTRKIDMEANMLHSLLVCIKAPVLTQDDIPWIRTWPSGVIQKALTIASELSGQGVVTDSKGAVVTDNFRGPETESGEDANTAQPV